MAELNTDIVIFGAGIAGLWTFRALKAKGYNVLLLESHAIGGGQSIASQGIIHAGLKFALAGKINKLAKTLSEMPQIWRACLQGRGPIDLSSATSHAEHQHLLIPSSLSGALVKSLTHKTLGAKQTETPQTLKDVGFEGSTIDMQEMVLDIPSVIEALAEPYRSHIRQINPDTITFNKDEHGAITSITDGAHTITAERFIFTGAASNEHIAKNLSHDSGLKTQHRPLLMGFLKPAPFPLYAHLIETNEKPIATITTHEMADGTLCWYLGARVAEREKSADPQEVYDAIHTALKAYLPKIDLSLMEFATLPIDRVEGQAGSKGWLPDTPTLHAHQNALYAWPTKLTFAPMLSDMIEANLEQHKIKPQAQMALDRLSWPQAKIAKPPWDEVKWTKIN